MAGGPAFQAGFSGDDAKHRARPCGRRGIGFRRGGIIPPLPAPFGPEDVPPTQRRPQVGGWGARSRVETRR